jgi:nucleoside 2-deoxyribosyltransferase
MTALTVYLAGPIAGGTFDEGSEWRSKAAARLLRKGITALSPLRAKSFLKKVGVLSQTGVEHQHISPLSTSRGIMARDRWDCHTADIVLVYLLGATKVSIGTVMEIAWAHQARKPVVCVMEQGNIHEHMMITEAIDYHVSTLTEAVDIIAALVGPR